METTLWPQLDGFPSHWAALSCRALSGVTRSQTVAISRDGLPAAAARLLCGRTLTTRFCGKRVGVYKYRADHPNVYHRMSQLGMGSIKCYH
jgi:hypothetical protein